MKNCERGGILSKLFIIPTVLVLIGGVFFLGYYLGRYRGSNASDADLPPLPDIVSQNIPKPEEFTFYRTLTAREDKTVSIDLHPGPAPAEGPGERRQADNPAISAPQAPKKKEAAGRSGGATAAPEPIVKSTARKAPEPQKKEAPAKQTSSSKQRYSLQISSHQERQSAELEVKKMKHQGFAAFVVSTQLQGKGTWYRVRVGSFTNRTAAERLQKEVRAKAGVSSIVVTE